MLRILLVDDDKIIRKGLKRIIEKINVDYVVIGEAANGEEALDFMNKDIPDLLITDVKMPVMNGIELCKEVKKKYDHVRMVVLSGFDDFQYVREAMKNGVVDYLLKPVDNKDVKSLLENITCDVHDKNSQQSSAAVLKKKIEESNVILNERFLRNLLHTSSEDFTTTVLLPKNSYSENINSYILCVVDWELQLSELIKIYQEKNNFYPFVLLQKIYAYIKEKGMINDVLITDCKDKTVMVWQCKENAAENQMNDVLTKLSSMREYFETVYQIKLFFCVTYAYETIEQSREAYKLAKQGIEKFFYAKQEIIIVNDDTKWGENESYQVQKIYEKIYKIIIRGQIEQITEEIRNFYFDFEKQCISPEQVRKQTLEFLKIFINENTYGINYMNEKIEMLSYMIGYMQTNDIICECVVRFILTAINEIAAENEKGKNVIKQAKKYIQENYYKEITLKEVAEYIDLNPNYFSTMFKNETKKTFMDYLTDVRIEEAKKLLEYSTLKIYEVGYEIGYKDTVTFNRAFKRVTGISPKEYRNR